MTTSKRYDVLSPRAKKDGGTYWHRVGMAFEGEKGISIEFNSLPLPDKEGRVRVSLFEPREKEDKPAQSNGETYAEQRPAPARKPAAPRQDLDDEIPF